MFCPFMKPINAADNRHNACIVDAVTNHEEPRNLGARFLRRCLTMTGQNCTTNMDPSARTPDN